MDTRSSSDPAAPLRQLPGIDALLKHDDAHELLERFGREMTLRAVRQSVQELREAGRTDSAACILASCRERLETADQSLLRPVFNMTGVVLSTNLGRAILPAAAVTALVESAQEACSLEYDLDSGRRGERDTAVRGLIRELTGAEDALVVNNNAAAVLLALTALAKGKETVVSRGELIEIGGSFRMPDIMRMAGTKLVETGTTNRTHARDYQDALSSRTAVLMKVHPSNYRIEGFTAVPEASDLAAIAKTAGAIFFDELGSGTLVDLSHHGLPRERTVQDALRAGADIVTFSGDKLLGGPQVGIIAGRKDLVVRCARHPLKRALRADKLRLAALEATLKLYRDPDRLAARLPTLRFFTRPKAELVDLATRMMGPVEAALGSGWHVAVVDLTSQIGSGALPLETLPSAGLSIRPTEKRAGLKLETLARRLRLLPKPVIGRIQDGALLLDLRCLTDEDGFLRQIDMWDARA